MSDVNVRWRKTPEKTTLNLESNPSSRGNDRYVGVIIARKQVKAVAIISVLLKAWEDFGVVRIKETTNRVMLFDFDNEETQEQIFDMSPWSV